MTSTSHREERGRYLIEAGATDLQQGSRWLPWVRLTLLRRADGCASRKFDRLKCVFGTQEAAIRYATELGRSLADEGIDLRPASGGGTSAPRPLIPVTGRKVKSGMNSLQYKRGYRSATFTLGVLAGAPWFRSH